MKSTIITVWVLLLFSCKKEHASSKTYELLQNTWHRAYSAKRFITSDNFISSWDTTWFTGFYIDLQKDGKYILSGTGGFNYTTDYKIISDTAFFIYTTTYRTPDAPADTFYIRKLTNHVLVFYRKKLFPYSTGWSMDEYIDSLSR